MKRIILLIVLCCALCGCTTEADRIYTICKTVGDTVYVYNEEGFFTYENKTLKRYLGKDLKKIPKLVLNLPEETDFTLTQELPSVYTGNLNDALSYVSKLLQDGETVFQVTYCDWNMFEMYIRSESYNARVVYTSDGTVRVYAIDVNGNAITPPFL